MASGLSDIGMFLPTQSRALYGNPGAYDEALKAEAAKNADYLSSMDQFYAQLDQAQKQYESTLAYNVETRNMQNTLAQEQLAQQKELTTASLAQTKQLTEEQIALGYANLNASTASQQNQLAFQQQQLRQQGAYQSGLLNIEQQKQTNANKAFDLQSQLYGKQMSLTDYLLNQMQQDNSNYGSTYDPTAGGGGTNPAYGSGEVNYSTSGSSSYIPNDAYSSAINNTYNLPDYSISGGF